MWLLIVVLVTSGSVQMKTIPFATQAACVKAKVQVEGKYQYDTTVTARCVETQ